MSAADRRGRLSPSQDPGRGAAVIVTLLPEDEGDRAHTQPHPEETVHVVMAQECHMRTPDPEGTVRGHPAWRQGHEKPTEQH